MILLKTAESAAIITKSFPYNPNDESIFIIVNYFIGFSKYLVIKIYKNNILIKNYLLIYFLFYYYLMVFVSIYYNIL